MIFYIYCLYHKDLHGFCMKVISYLIALVFGIINFANAAEPKPWEMYFQPPVSPVMHAFYDFHNELMVIITAITLFVTALLAYVMIRYNKKSNPVPNKFTHNVTVEVIWTVIPLFILAYIAVPSFKTLYMSDVTPKSEITLKVVGHQWYWEYIYPDMEGKDDIRFDSYMIKDEDLKEGQKRLLEVDNQVVLPVDTVVKILVTSADVIHSFALPAFGLKTDAIPGRTNETWVKIEKPGVYYGQCSQLCGVNHAFMPIAIKAVSKEEYAEWLKTAKTKFSGSYNHASIK
ncbi:MAG: cytochrome c oxidase subunit II [Alphaproteobacteria bacterium 33-17]|nr:MAG: cytochrome c oxidase subunit II [Alphaproteobacteria bacterium 33-17]